MAAISFARGVPSSDCFPIAELAECAKAVVERDGRTVLSYGRSAGYLPLREWIGERHGVGPERVLVTNGSLQAFSVFATRLAGRGRVLVEAPTYDRSLTILRQLGAEVAGVPLDDDGLDVGALERTLAGGWPTAFLYTIPTFQNPSGRTLAPERRRRLAALARDGGLLVYEDDPYGLVRFEGEALPTIFELTGGEGVVYASSFSKTVAPGLRVGYAVLPAELASEVEAVATSTYLTPGLLAQGTVYEFLRRGALEGHVERVRDILRARRDAMLSALERELGERGASWSRPEGGYFVWLELPDGMRAEVLLEQARDAVAFVPGTGFFLPGHGGENEARLAFSYATPAEIDEGVTRLAALVPAPAAA